MISKDAVLTKPLKPFTILVTALLILMASGDLMPTVFGQEQSTADQTKLLVDPEWLEEHLKEVRVISLEKKPSEFKIGHIPNAAYVDWQLEMIDTTNRNLYRILPQADFEAMLSKIGVTPETTIVLADNVSNRISLRMYWMLKTYGHPDVRILNGGIPAWKRAGKKFTDKQIDFKQSQYKALKTRDESAADFADTDTVRQSLKRGSTIIDGRPTTQFTGEDPGVVFHTKKEHKRRGHIESAVNIPWRANFNDDGTFKSKEALKKLYANVSPNKETVTYCNEGLHAATTWFVLKEMLGHPQVRLYDDSMAIWANRTDTPMTMPKP